MYTSPPATRPCTRPAIWRISFAPRYNRVSTLRPRRGGGRHKHRHTAPLPHDLFDEPLVQELERLLGEHAHLGGFRRVERPGLEHLDRVQITGVEGGIHGRREPDEAATGPLAEGEAELEFRRRLVDFLHHERVARSDQPVLE